MAQNEIIEIYPSDNSSIATEDDSITTLEQLESLEPLESSLNQIKSCQKCSSQLSSQTTMFCSVCGFIQINNKYLQEKTTAQYDPTSKQYKPWKESVIMATNSWKNRNLNVLVTKKEPWKPTMNQKNVYLKKGHGKPTQVPWPIDQSTITVGTATTSQQLNSPTDDSRRLKFSRLNSKKIVRYNGRLWSKSGDVYKKKKTVFSPEMIFGYEPKNRKVTDILQEDDDSFLSIQLYPLGIYLIDWIKDKDIEVKIHLTLLRRSFQSKYHHLLSNHWLRIGYEIESISITQSENNSTIDSNLIVLGYLPNSIAKCFGATIGGEWVDLPNFPLQAD